MERESLPPAGRFNHCATVLGFEDGLLVAYYAGTAECQDDQHVVLTFKRDGRWIDLIKLENKTGNPLLFKFEDKTYLAYSRFEKDCPGNLVKKWAYCSLWCREIVMEEGHPGVGEPLPTFKHPQLGYLFRAAPLYLEGRTILPLYREEGSYGAAYEWMGDHLKLVGKIGYGCNSTMQPTLWHDGTAFHSLSRNCQPQVYGGYCWHSTSPDLERWSHPELEQSLDNNHNSVAVVNDGQKDPLVIWNVGRSRNDLRLGKLCGHTLGRSLVTLNGSFLGTQGYGAYPNYCFYNEELHLVWTDLMDGRHTICHMRLEEKEWKKLRNVQSAVRSPSRYP